MSSINRRRMLGGAVAAGLAAGLAPELAAADTKTGAAAGKPALKGRIKHSVCNWCFMSAGEKWDLDTLCQVVKGLGVGSVELLGAGDFATAKKHGLTCAIAGNGMPGAPFMRGFNNPRFHEEVIARTKQAIDACADAGFPSVIGFSGYKWINPDDPKSGEISRDEGAKNMVQGIKQVAGHAEKKGVTLCIEHLNTRDDSHPMKGHPGYQADDVDWLAAVLRQVGSPRVKMLFDIYHIQVMHGDVIRRLDQNKDILGHVHTAGNPGRNELDDNQEINYPAIMKKLVSLGYKGYVGHEFIPTRDPRAGLRQAVTICDV